MLKGMKKDCMFRYFSPFHFFLLPCIGVCVFDSRGELPSPWRHHT